MENIVYNQVLSLLRSAIWGEERFPFVCNENMDWEAIYKELKAQSVQCIPLDLLARNNPQSVQKYIITAGKGMKRWYKILQNQQKLCDMFHSEDIACAVLKGTSAACYYTQPSSRMMGDIDILVSAKDFDRACELVAKDAEFLRENYRHKEYKWNNVIVEVHRSFSANPNLTLRKRFDERILPKITSSEKVSLEDYHFYRLPAVENGFILLEHINTHLHSGLGLRQIIDWMMYVDKELNDELWLSEFAPFLRTLNLETLALTVTRMCQIYLGLRTDITWCKDADEALCEELIDYILYQGNFGRKKETGTNVASNVISISKNPIALFRILQQRGCINWADTLKRHPYLTPFAWLHQIFRYLRKGFSTKHPLRFLKDAAKQSNPQNTLLEKLGASRIAEEAKRQ